MNVTIKKSSWRALAQIGLWVAGLALFAVTLDGRTQDPARQELLPPSKSNLVPVHWPLVTNMEADVREQLLALQNALTAAATNPATAMTNLSEAYGTMGELYQAYSLISPARECYLNAGILAPKDFRWVYLLAQLDQQEGRSEEAINLYRAARALRPDYVAVPVNLGNIYLELDRLADAESSFHEALAIEKRSPAALYGLGQIALSKRSYAAAVDHFEKALAQVPEANRIHYSLAMAYRGLGDAAKARIHLAQQGPVGVRVADPLLDELRDLTRGERVHLIRGKLAVDAQSYAEAAAEFRKALAAKPDSLAARLNLGTTLTQLRDFRGAIVQFEEVLRIDPQNTLAHFNLAVLLANDNRHEPAIAHLQSVLAVDPNDLGSRVFLGQELKKSGRFDEALIEFSRVVGADPDHEGALLEQVELLLRKKQFQQALQSLEDGHARYPQKGQTAVMLAYLLAASPQNDLRDGGRALELAQLVYKATGSVDHGVVVALALAELGRCDEASAWLRQMIVKAGEGKAGVVKKLKGELARSERLRPCRPTGDLIFSDQSLSR